MEKVTKTNGKEYLVTLKEAEKLMMIRNSLREAVEINEDYKGVYDRLVKILTNNAEEYDIALPQKRFIGGKKKKFTPEEIREVALNKLTRYLFYQSEPGLGLKEITKRFANNNQKNLSNIIKNLSENYEADIKLGGDVNLANWFYAQKEIAAQIHYHHWGTALEAVEVKGPDMEDD